MTVTINVFKVLFAAALVLLFICLATHAKAEWKHQCVYKDGAYTCCYSTDDGKNWYCS